MALHWFAIAPIHFDLVRAFNIGDQVPDSVVAAHPDETGGRVMQIDVPNENPSVVLRPLLTSDRDTDNEREGFVPARLSAATMKANFAARTHVVVDPSGAGNYTTLAAAFAAFPAGNVWVELTSGSHALAAPLTGSGVKNVVISGQGRDTTTVNCASRFIVATSNSDAWTVRDLKVQRDPGTNTDDGIDVDYARRWSVRNCNFAGFGGSSIRYRGGIHSEILSNFILAKDSTNTNGFAGIHVEKSSGGVVATLIHSSGNYVGTGIQYGILFDSVNVGCVSVGDAAELCDVGIRLVVSAMTVINPYTEANRVNGMEFHDSTATLIGRVRDEPVVTWANVAAVDRVITRMDRYFINPGKAVVFGGSSGIVNPDTAPSDRAGTGSPEGLVTAVRGSTWRRKDGGTATSLYVKETGTGNTGWVAHGAGLTGDVLDTVRNNRIGTINTVQRESAQSSNAITAGTLYLTLFTPAQALTVTKLAACSGSPAWAGSTLTRMGLYVINGDGTATLVAATLSDPAMFQVANTAYTKSLDIGGGLPASYQLVAGQRYATAVIGVGVTAGTLRGAAVLNGLAARAPLIAATGGTGLTDLPVGPVTLTSSGSMNWSELAA